MTRISLHNAAVGRDVHRADFTCSVKPVKGWSLGELSDGIETHVLWCRFESRSLQLNGYRQYEWPFPPTESPDRGHRHPRSAVPLTVERHEPGMPAPESTPTARSRARLTPVPAPRPAATVAAPLLSQPR
jgi:hypothetical protein